MSLSLPLDHARRSPIHRTLSELGATWRDIGDAHIADGLGSVEQARTLGIADLSPLRRWGFKGRDTLDAMASRGVVFENRPNTAYRQHDGSLCLVLGPSEVLLLANPLAPDANIATDYGTWTYPDLAVYQVPRRDSHLWFAVTGKSAPQMLAKICAVDLRCSKLPDLTVVQATALKLSTIFLRSILDEICVYHLLADTASALYFWTSIIEAAREFSGQPVGLKAIQDLQFP